jgi:multidrug efflux pump subunit AcrB
MSVIAEERKAAPAQEVEQLVTRPIEQTIAENKNDSSRDGG